MHSIVTAFQRANRVGTAGIMRAGRERVVAALAIGGSDRMNGRQIEDVAAHGGDAWELRDHVLKRTVVRDRFGLRTWEELVPIAERGTLALDLDSLNRAAREERPGVDRRHCGSRLF